MTYTEHEYDPNVPNLHSKGVLSEMRQATAQEWRNEVGALAMILVMLVCAAVWINVQRDMRASQAIVVEVGE